ncbi:hypothetical protein LINPERHAP2_LOCUS35008 [Linum perenne]
MGIRDDETTNFWNYQLTGKGECLIDSVIGDPTMIDSNQLVRICLGYKFLWRYRNGRVFNDKLTTAVTLTRHIQAWVALVGDTLDRDRSITYIVPPVRTEVCISWEFVGCPSRVRTGICKRSDPRLSGTLLSTIL